MTRCGRLCGCSIGCASIDVFGEARGGRPARQRSLRAVLDSTLALLDPSARMLFVRMGAFAGPVEPDELERVLSGDGVSMLEELALRQLASELLDREPDGERWRREHAQRQYELVGAFRTWSVDPKDLSGRPCRGAGRGRGAALRLASANHDPLEQPVAAPSVETDTSSSAEANAQFRDDWRHERPETWSELP